MRAEMTDTIKQATLRTRTLVAGDAARALTLDKQFHDLQRDVYQTALIDAISILGFFALLPLNTWFITEAILRNASEWYRPVWVAAFLLSPFIGFYVSDALSAILHWSVDTWGSLNTPILGGNIRSFRQHHLHPHMMVRHRFVETNGQNCMAALPIAILCITLLALHHGADTPPIHILLSLVLYFTSLAVALTNQFHTWAHRLPSHPLLRAVVEWLQNANIILEPRYHHTHHASHVEAYGITNGWSDALLLPFFKQLERFVIYVTNGTVAPRDNDNALRSMMK